MTENGHEDDRHGFDRSEGGGGNEAFVRMFASAQREIYRYILVLIPHEADAMEVFQETCVVLWRKFQPMPSERDFIAWACRVAYYEVLKLRRQQGREQLKFNDLLLDQIAEERLELTDLLESRRLALAQCLEKLSQRDRELVDRRYHDQLTAKEVSERVGRPVNTVYKALERIRRQLFDCVSRALRVEEHSQ